jgi:diguanylate cyclase (GGDEF)-like protein
LAQIRCERWVLSMTLLNRLFILVLIALTPSIVVQVYNQIDLYRTQLVAVENGVLQEAMRRAAEHDQVTEAVRELLVAVASQEPVLQQNSDACNAALTALSRQYPNYAYLGAVDRDGVRFCSSAKPFPGRVSLAERSFFKQVKRGKDFAVGDYQVSLVNKVQVLDFGSPYFDANGVLKGAVYAGLALARINASMLAHSLPPRGELIIADRNAVVIASAPDPSWIGKTLPQAHLATFNSNLPGEADLPGLDGVMRLFGYVPLASPLGDGVYVAYGLEKNVALADIRTSMVRGVAAGAVGVFMALLMTFWYGRRFIRRPVSTLLAIAEQWRRGGWAARASTGEMKTEFGQLARAFNEMAETVHAELAQRAQTEILLTSSRSEVLRRSAMLEAHSNIVGLLATMAHRLQSCMNEEEFADVVSRFASQSFPGVPGALYLLSNSRNLLRAVATWNAPAGLECEFAPTECWALRRGQIHTVTAIGSEVVCGHVKQDKVTGYSCRPLVAQGETIGLLYVEAISHATEAEMKNPLISHDLDIFAENISLAIGNQRLRDTLRSQSIRDPLTGLFNRRYLEEALELDLARATRSGSAVSVIMGDVDHFKKFNDTFGHDAGDLVLKRVAEVMRVNIRKGDLACRYGGEEFIILLHSADIREATARAETIREAIKSLDIIFRGQTLGSVTISLGVATFPAHADNGEALITAADSAMYEAKRAGRNRVETASQNRVESSATADM